MSQPSGQSGDAPSIWVLTDGKIGDDVQCIAVASALTSTFEKKVIAPQAPWSWLAPWGPIDPRDKPTAHMSVLKGDPPDLVIASGRRAIPYARVVKKRSAGRSRVVILKDPRFGRDQADFIWAPAHDRVRGANVFSTLTSPHHLAAALEESKNNPCADIAALAKPLLGVVLGGPSGGARYGKNDAIDLAGRLELAARGFGGVAITPSRRTPNAFLEVLREALPKEKFYLWDRTGDNPYVDILAHTEALIVAADSHNMMSEAMAAGCGVYAYRPPGLSGKMQFFVEALKQDHGVREFDNTSAPFKTTPFDATPAIVDAIRARLNISGN